MNEALLIVGILAILFSLIALIVGCIAISICVGLKNSTHTIQWKPLDFKEVEDPLKEFMDDELVPEENPLKKKKKPKDPEDFAFMEDVTDQSNF